MLSRRRAVPYSLLAVATLATLTTLGPRAVASTETTPDSSPSRSAAGPSSIEPRVSAPAGPALVGAPAPAAFSDAVRLSGPTVLWTGDTGTWVALAPGSAGAPLAGTPHSTLAAATKAASTWSFPPPNTAGPVSQGDLCITIPPGAAGSTVTTSPCSGVAAQQLLLVDSPNGKALRSSASSKAFADFRPESNTFQTQSQARGDGVQTALLQPVGLRALAVWTITPGTVGTATFSGPGTPGGAVHNGTRSVRILDTGRWTMTVSDLPAGGGAVVFEQSVNGTRYPPTTVTVPAWPTTPVAPTAEATFPEDVHLDAIIHGTGVDGATVTIRSDSETIGTALVSGGAWSTDISALGSGMHELTVTQTLDGLESLATSVSIDYGAAVSITSPAP